MRYITFALLFKYEQGLIVCCCFSHFTVSAIVKIHLLVGLKFYMSHLYFQLQIFQQN